MPTFNRVSASGAVDGLMISDLSGKQLLSMGRQATTGLTQAVAQEQKVRRELVLDSESSPALALAFPLYYRGKAKGRRRLPGRPRAGGRADRRERELGGRHHRQDGEYALRTDPQQASNIDWSALAGGEARWGNHRSRRQVITRPRWCLSRDSTARSATFLALERDVTAVTRNVDRIGMIQNIAVVAVVLLAHRRGVPADQQRVSPARQGGRGHAGNRQR